MLYSPILEKRAVSGDKGKNPLNEGVIQGDQLSNTHSKPFMVGSHKGSRSTSVPQHIRKVIDSPPIISGSRFAPLDLELEDKENHGKFSQLERDNIPPVSAGIDFNAIKEKIKQFLHPKRYFWENHQKIP
ncbi:hypothetical protein ACH5RR_013619 [Cinchona calisaya]|uniref:Uncharacterized protein n=1 Tax=Cinchona calisaya TaxID=153742 RepID=A0ABD3A378_9GENT